MMQEIMSNQRAIRFPFVGSALLLSLFLLFKFLSKDLVNDVFTLLFFVVGIVNLSYILYLASLTSVLETLFNIFLYYYYYYVDTKVRLIYKM
jgi:hypothetical protein